jgi:hypothetical protein
VMLYGDVFRDEVLRQLRIATELFVDGVRIVDRIGGWVERHIVFALWLGAACAWWLYVVGAPDLLIAVVFGAVLLLWIMEPDP